MKRTITSKKSCLILTLLILGFLNISNLGVSQFQMEEYCITDQP